MQNAFDWLRICRTGGELLATLDLLSDEPHLPEIISQEDRLGVPQTAFCGPCLRCHYFSRLTNNNFCYFCNHVMTRETVIRPFSRHSVALWGFVNYPLVKMPKTEFDVFYNTLDENRFICITNRWNLKTFLQEVSLVQGPDWLGLIQLFPVFAGGGTTTMSDVICSAIHEENNIMMNQLYIQFYSSPFQLFRKKERDREGKLTFTLSEFIGYLEMAEIFKRGLYLEEQDQLLEVLNIKDATEKQFYWGRFIGQIRPEARDFLDSWNMRTWSSSQVSLFYELLDFAKFDPDKCISNVL